MSNQKHNPKQEWGFYACTPRIVRTQYKQLSHTEKWLYVCLKDLCGDRGMCYRTLKVLSEETDLSTGNLSTGIRNLHEAGLIHAEKKRRTNNPTGKEVWHITIVDIWQANVEYCSKNERSQEDVQAMNNNVQILNEPAPQRSENEPQRSNFVDRRKNNEERTISEEKTESEITSTEPAHEGTHTSFPDNQFARAMTIGDYPQSNNMRDVGVPSDNTEKPQPPHPKKNHINYDVPEEILARARTLRSKWIEAYGPYGDAKWDNDALIWIAQQDNGTFENVQKVCERWENIKPGEPVHPEQVKNKWFWANDKKKASSPKSISGRRRVEETDPAYAEYLSMMTGGGK